MSFLSVWLSFNLSRIVKAFLCISKSSILSSLGNKRQVSTLYEVCPLIFLLFAMGTDISGTVRMQPCDSLQNELY